MHVRVNILPRNNKIFNMFSYKRYADTYQLSPNKNALITLINLSYIHKLSIDNKKTACSPCRPWWVEQVTEERYWEQETR